VLTFGNPFDKLEEKAKVGVGRAMSHIPQNERKAGTKKKIVEAAMTLFSTKGYYQTNSKEIVKEAGIAVGSFYRHFSDKKDVLKYILDSYIQDALSETSDPNDYTNSAGRKEALTRLIHRCFDLHRFTPGFYQQVTLLSSVDEEISQIFNEYRTAIYSRINDLITIHVPGLSAEKGRAACTIIYSAIEGAIHAVKFLKADVEEELLIEELMRFVDSYLSALIVDNEM
jgi:AcrR family transcriptional regulator